MKKLGDAAVTIELLQNKTQRSVRISVDNAAISCNKGNIFYVRMIHNFRYVQVITYIINKYTWSLLYLSLASMCSRFAANIVFECS